MRPVVFSLILLLTAALCPLGVAQAGERPDFSFQPSAQYRLRFYHFEGKNFTKNDAQNILRHRARLGMKASWKDIVGAFLQVQDVRTFGEETDSLGDFSADGFDLHQGYLIVTPTPELELRAGRQEILWENQRLVGNVGFTEQARSLDAIRAMYRRGALVADLFYAKVSENGAFAAKPNPDDLDVVAVDLHYSIEKLLGVSLLFIADIGGANDRTRFTAGVVGGGSLARGLAYGFEGYYQFGSADADESFAAFLASARISYNLGGRLGPFVELFGDFVSGDDDPNDKDTKTFDTLFATNHKFYGEMDFFLNLPVHTAGRGLMDVGGILGIKPSRSFVTKVTLHHFRSMEDAGATDSGVFGTEIDLRINYQVVKPLKLDLVYGIFLPGEIFKNSRGDTPEHLVFVTADASF